jgi:peptidoglycan hydrolase-like protein with peptidoglycan-binding domain
MWGPQTEQALKDFQQAQGMEATGELNEETLSALEIDDTQTAGTSTQESGASAGGTAGEGKSQ